MATHGLTDAFTTISVPKSEYEELIRESEQNRIIRSLLGKNRYVSTEDLKVILDVEEPQAKEGEE